MRRKHLIIGAILLLALSSTACTNNVATNGTGKYDDAAKVLTEVKTTQFFTEEKVADEDAEKILSAGAQLLGYGTKIMTAPTMALNNDEYKEMLSVPEGQKIAAVLIVGKPATGKDNTDAVSSATTRNAFGDMVTIISK